MLCWKKDWNHIPKMTLCQAAWCHRNKLINLIQISARRFPEWPLYLVHLRCLLRRLHLLTFLFSALCWVNYHSSRSKWAHKIIECVCCSYQEPLIPLFCLQWDTVLTASAKIIDGSSVHRNCMLNLIVLLNVFLQLSNLHCVCCVCVF